MKTVSYKELEDFHRCDVYHTKRYIDNEKPPRERTQAGFDGHSNIVLEAESTIKNLTDYYFHRLMDDHQPRIKTVIGRWGRLWLSDMTSEQICFDPVPVSRYSKIKVNTAAVRNIHRFCSTFKKPFKPTLVRETILLPIRDIVLSADIDMAYRTNSGVLRIVKFTPYKVSPGKPSKDLDLIIQACAWMHISGEKEVEIAYYNMLAPPEYDPMSVNTITNEVSVHLAKLVDGYTNKKSANIVSDCKGCEYRCNEKEVLI